MELFETINTRCSIRAFKNTPVEEEKLEKILNAAIRAPSTGNLQPWEFIVVKKKETKRAIVRAALEQIFIEEAPVVIVVCANTERTASRYGERGKNLYCIQDCANATMLLMLAAHAEGLGSVWVGAFDESELQRILKLPSYVRPLAIIPIGYPDEELEISERLSLERVKHEEKY